MPVKITVPLNGALTTDSIDKTRGNHQSLRKRVSTKRRSGPGALMAVRNTRVITHLMLIMPIAGRDCFILVRPIRLTISDRVWLSTGCERLTKSSPVPAPVLYNERACSIHYIGSQNDLESLTATWDNTRCIGLCRLGYIGSHCLNQVCVNPVALRPYSCNQNWNNRLRKFYYLNNFNLG